MTTQTYNTSGQNTGTATSSTLPQLTPQGGSAFNAALERALGNSQSGNYYSAIGPMRVQGLEGAQVGALNNTWNLAGYQPQQVQAGQVNQYAGGTGPGGLGLNGMSLNGYMNPYISSVLQSQMALQGQQDAQQQQQLVGNQALQGAFGGDRGAIQQATLAGQQALANNLANSQTLQSGYTQAQNTAEADINRQLQAGTAQAQLGLQAGQGNQFAGLQGANLGLNANAQLFNQGTAQQQTQQAYNLAQYQNAINTAQLPYQQSQYLNQSLQGLLPYAAGTNQVSSTAGTQRQQLPGPSLISQIGGLGTAIGGLAGTGALSGIGSAIGGIGSGIGSALSGLFGSGSNYGSDINSAGGTILQDLGFVNALADGGVVRGHAGGGDVDEAASDEDYVPVGYATATEGPAPSPAAVQLPAPQSPQGLPATPPDRVAMSASAATPMPAPGLPLSPGNGPVSGAGPSPVGGQPAGNGWALPVLAAGLGMMASRSPFPLSAVGEGGLAGLQEYNQQRQLAPELAIRNAQAQQAQLGLQLQQAEQPAQLEIARELGAAAVGSVPGAQGGVSETGGGLSGQPMLGATPIAAGGAQVPSSGDPIADAAVHSLLQQQRYYQLKSMLPGGAAFARPLAQVTSTIENVANNGRVIGADGHSHMVGGAMQGRLLASQADAQGKVGPELQQAAGKASIRNNTTLTEVSPGMWQTQAQVIAGAGGAPTASAPVGNLTGEQLFPAFFQQETGSGANPDTSVQGATGDMQLMPETFRQFARPGESIDSRADNRAVGKRILADYAQRYAGDPARVATAYFSGPGNVAPPGSPTPWVRDIPDATGKTTSSYVSDILNRLGSAQNAQGAAPPGYAVTKLPGGGISYQNTAPQQNQQYEKDLKDTGELSDDVLKSQAEQARLTQMRSLVANIKPGAMGETRAALANWVETFLPQKAAKFTEQIAHLPDAASAQQFAKLALVEAGTQERSTLGARGSLGATKLYQRANPSIDLQGSASVDILDTRLIQQQLDNDYAQSAQHWVNQNGQAWTARTANYKPLQQFDEQWTAQRNPQVGFAAMEAVTGKPFAEWSKGLTADEGRRALGLIYRADPNATILNANGESWPVARFAPQQTAAQ